MPSRSIALEMADKKERLELNPRERFSIHGIEPHILEKLSATSTMKGNKNDLNFRTTSYPDILILDI